MTLSSERRVSRTPCDHELLGYTRSSECVTLSEESVSVTNSSDTLSSERRVSRTPRIHKEFVTLCVTLSEESVSATFEVLYNAHM